MLSYHVPPRILFDINQLKATKEILSPHHTAAKSEEIRKILDPRRKKRKNEQENESLEDDDATR